MNGTKIPWFGSTSSHNAFIGSISSIPKAPPGTRFKASATARWIDFIMCINCQYALVFKVDVCGDTKIISWSVGLHPHPDKLMTYESHFRCFLHECNRLFDVIKVVIFPNFMHLWLEVLSKICWGDFHIYTNISWSRTSFDGSTSSV